MLSRTALVTCAALSCMFAVPQAASAERHHTVKRGDTLARISKKYGIPVTILKAANPGKAPAGLRPGHVLEIPEPGVIYVRSGDTISSIAKRHHVTRKELLKVNRLKTTSMLRLGQRLLLPGYEPASRRQAARKRWGRPRRPGVAKLVRSWSGKPRVVRLLRRSGKVSPAGRRALSRLMRSKRSKRTRLPPTRLVRVLARISDHFGGRKIHIISGYRKAGGYTQQTSRHTRGHALDIRIQGVPNTALRNYCRTLPRVGCGYYPRSTFVHVDVRDKRGHWVDWSRPGQKPMYAKPEERKAANATKADIDKVDEEDRREAQEESASAKESVPKTTQNES